MTNQYPKPSVYIPEELVAAMHRIDLVVHDNKFPIHTETGKADVAAVQAIRAHVQAMAKEIERCHERLEITHAYRLNQETDTLEKFDIPMSERHDMVDGISARDETIKLLDKDIAALSQALRDFKGKTNGSHT